MKQKQFSMYQYTLQQITTAFYAFSQKVGYFLQEDQTKTEIETRLSRIESLFAEYEKDLPLPALKRYFCAPQVEDLISACLEHMLTETITGVYPKSDVDQDGVMIHLLKVLEEHFPELANDRCEEAMRIYFTQLFRIVTEKIPLPCYDDFVREDGALKADFLFWMDQEQLLHIYDVTSEKIAYYLKNEFIPENKKFENFKLEYSRTYKQLFQNGFIYLLGEYRFNDFYVPPILLKSNKLRLHYRYMNFENHNEYRKAWKRIFDSKAITYVVGGAGYGKSLFLRNLINNYSKMNFPHCGDYLVIYCDLKTYYTNGSNNKKTIVDFLQESMVNTTGLDNISKEFVTYFIKQGRCLILLDALDEVPKSVREELHKKIVVFFKNQNPGNKICITSRDRGFIPQKEVEVEEIYPLVEQDIRDYLGKMVKLKKFKSADTDLFMQQAKVLIDKHFLNNFLVLSLLVSIYKAEKALPENKIDLYKKCFEYIAKKREEEKSKTGYNWENIYPLMKDSTFITLAVLAAPNNKDIPREEIERRLIKQYRTKYADEVTAEKSIKEFLEFCSNRTELFVPAAVDDKYKFFHRSFFEYFYSRYIHQQHSVAKMYDLMSSFDIDSEVFELTTALVKEDNEEKYQKLIEYMIQSAEKKLSNKNSSTTAFSILTLAMQVVDDAYYIAEYYRLVMEYHQVLSETSSQRINNRLVAAWIKKALANHEDRLLAFTETYRLHSVQYVLSWFADAWDTKKNCSKYSEQAGFFMEVNGIEEYVYSPVQEAKIPYYIAQFESVTELRSFMDASCAVPYSDFIAQYHSSANRKQRSKISNGYKAYNMVDPKEKEQLLNVFFYRNKR